jgi:hypothetical protein
MKNKNGAHHDVAIMPYRFNRCEQPISLPILKWAPAQDQECEGDITIVTRFGLAHDFRTTWRSSNLHETWLLN